MAYTINYTPEDNKRWPIKKTVCYHKWIPVAVSLTVCLLLLNTTIRNALIDFLLPGDPQVTKSAIVQLVENIKAGEGFGHCVTAFCQYVIAHG